MVTGLTPPWEGRSLHYGGWRRGEELWDGSGWEWLWLPPRGAMTQIMHDFYISPITAMLNEESMLISRLMADVSLR